MKITRKTGFFGTLTKVKVKIDNQEIDIRNNETQEFETQEKVVTVKARQAYFGSAKVQVEDTKEIEIKSNNLAIFGLYLSALIIVFSSIFNFFLFNILGLILLALATIYSIKNWFILEVK